MCKVIASTMYGSQNTKYNYVVNTLLSLGHITAHLAQLSSLLLNIKYESIIKTLLNTCLTFLKN
jgi:hypothetical protein